MAGKPVVFANTPRGKAGVAGVVHRAGGHGCGRWLVWAHGGSWLKGSAFEWRGATGQLASASGINVLSVDYRLAPAHKYPAAVKDVLAAANWIKETKTDATSIMVGGDSAGGTIAALAALAARDTGLNLAAHILAYPPLDPACQAPSYHRNKLAFPQANALRPAWRSWLGQASSPLFCQPRSPDMLAGISPAVLVVGEHDPVLDDVEQYARDLTQAGVQANFRRLDGVGHGDFLNPNSAVISAIAEAISNPDFGTVERRK